MVQSVPRAALQGNCGPLVVLGFAEEILHGKDAFKIAT